MSRPAGDPLTRTSINLFTHDLDFLRRRPGWQEKVRDLVHVYVKELKGEETIQYLDIPKRKHNVR